MNGATTIQKEIVADTTANFIIDLKSPGSNGEYIITVENRGTIDAYVKDIKGVVDSNKKEPKDIQFSIDGLKVNDKLKARETKTFKVKVNWSSNSTRIPETSKELSLTIDFVQDTNQVTSGGNITEFVQDLLETSPDGTYEYMGGTYLKGEQDSNYIWFDGFLWRIMGINEDGSIRMITEENVTAISWGTKAQDYDNSYVNDWLNNYFYPKLKDKDLLVNQTWCSEKSNDFNSMRTTCTNNLSKIQRPVGLLSMDEYNLANSIFSYLVNSQHYWTLTPSVAGYVYIVNATGPTNFYPCSNSYGIRPVINLIDSITISSGAGTLQDPFIIEDRSTTGKLNDHSLIGEYVTYAGGEYVTYAGRNYRVVETSSLGTKLILDGYYDSNNDGVIEESDKKAYGIINDECTLCKEVNEESFINWISNNSEIDKSKLSSITWYYSDMRWGDNYKKSLENTFEYSGSVGLIRVGEILSSQSQTVISKIHYWTSTISNGAYAWKIQNGGDSTNVSVGGLNAVRPVINIGPDVQILSGNGTFNFPYQLS